MILFILSQKAWIKRSVLPHESVGLGLDGQHGGRVAPQGLDADPGPQLPELERGVVRAGDDPVPLPVHLDAAHGVCVAHHGHPARDARPVDGDGEVPHLDGQVRAPTHKTVAV